VLLPLLLVLIPLLFVLLPLLLAVLLVMLPTTTHRCRFFLARFLLPPSPLSALQGKAVIAVQITLRCA
jgi:hypothetical protein